MCVGVYGPARMLESWDWPLFDGVSLAGRHRYARWKSSLDIRVARCWLGLRFVKLLA